MSGVSRRAGLVTPVFFPMMAVVTWTKHSPMFASVLF
jgi:hypothetical protein